MEHQPYAVVFEGQVVDGHELEQVKERLERFLKLSTERVEALLQARMVVLRQGLSHDKARKFQFLLYKLGIVTSLQPMQGEAAESADEAQAASATAGLRSLPVEFHGKGDEYFRIWIVNVVLSILTLGIYSAWAKVRTQRYFYGNTRLDGQSFEYLANPIAILKGRIIAALLFLIYAFGGQLAPQLAPVIGLLFLLIFPWLVVKSMVFRNHNTAYRNVRFGFDGGYRGALTAFIGWPLLAVVSLGLLAPVALQRQQAFLVGNARYGTAPFAFSAGVKAYYKVVAMFIVMVIGLLLVASLLSGLLPPLTPIAILVAYVYLLGYINAKLGNLLYNYTLLEQHGFHSSLEAGKLAMIYFTNWLLIAFTLGLAMPWTKVRLARYRAQNLSLQANGSLDSFAAAEQKHVGALGEEVGEVFDLDIGL